MTYMVTRVMCNQWMRSSVEQEHVVDEAARWGQVDFEGSQSAYTERDWKEVVREQ